VSSDHLRHGGARILGNDLRHIHPSHLDVVGWDTVPPPELTRHAPITDVVEPTEPRLVVLLGDDLQVAMPHRVGSALGHVAAVDPPLRLEHRLDNVLGARAAAEAHLVVRLATVQT